MPKDEWGVKRLCPHCASRFYDLKRDPMTCPECGHSFTAESLVMTRGRAMIAEKAVVKERDLDLDDLADDTDLDEAGSDTDLDDDLLDDDEDDNVSLDDIADVGGGEDDA
ncbi:TIGR02300 family protein [Frigidibacter sp. RF13]|uniref:TIGR02300 family protein n=1 Tax=Frigidibacter sp. RF13 TaxID=2997340 RepID=UPI00226F4641|nr:TIGR02300 family protein [Frigidibacter sp. RF13]MCY1125733.1 TIGR02300 family protein [Frigidibacter sp. RF13]